LQADLSRAIQRPKPRKQPQQDFVHDQRRWGDTLSGHMINEYDARSACVSLRARAGLDLCLECASRISIVGAHARHHSAVLDQEFQASGLRLRLQDPASFVDYSRGSRSSGDWDDAAEGVVGVQVGCFVPPTESLGSGSRRRRGRGRGRVGAGPTAQPVW
jgi:hypothetical protein